MALWALAVSIVTMINTVDMHFKCAGDPSVQQLRAIMHTRMEASISGANKPSDTASVLAKVLVALLFSTLAAGDALPAGVLDT